MVIAILKNDEISFLTIEEYQKYTEDSNYCELATLEEALDKMAEGNEDRVEDGCLVQIKEGIAVANDDNGLEIIVRC